MVIMCYEELLYRLASMSCDLEHLCPFLSIDAYYVFADSELGKENMFNTRYDWVELLARRFSLNQVDTLSLGFRLNYIKNMEYGRLSSTDYEQLVDGIGSGSVILDNNIFLEFEGFKYLSVSDLVKFIGDYCMFFFI